jgi:uncharacterized membrane protein YgcG
MRDLERSPRTIRWWSIPAALVVFLLMTVPALAAGPVQDDGNMFSATARTNAETRINQIQRDTGKSITVKTVANLGGKDVSTTADQFFQQQKLNGVLLYFSKDDKKFKITIGENTRQAIPTSEETAIRDGISQRFTANDFDGGLLNAIDRIGGDLRSAAPARTGQQTTAPATSKSGSGFPVALIVLLVLAVVVVGAIMLMRRNRAGRGPSGGGYGPQGGYGTPQGGYGPNYGPGYGQPGGGGNIGGSILGGAAAGIGGAIVGNAIYDHFRDRDDDNRDDGDRGSAGDYGAFGDDQGRVSDSPQDVGGWGDTGDAGAGDWGSSDAGSGDWGGDSGGGDPGSE